MKCGDNLFSIGEVAKSLGITRRMILNYEERGLVKPDVKHEPGGNRYYMIDNLMHIRSIRIFQNLKLSLDEIKSYFDGSTDLFPIIGRLEIMRNELNLTIERLYERADERRKEVNEVFVEEQVVFRKIALAKTVREKTNVLRDTALEAMRKYKTDTSRRMYFIEYNIDDPEKTSFCVSVIQESQGKEIVRIPSVKALCMYHHGSYDELPSVRKWLADYAVKNGYKPLGTCRQVYIEGPPQRGEENRYITQVLLPIEKERDLHPAQKQTVISKL